ncbi:1,4-alpha-glucan branching protein GlgB [Hippea maritima]|uniref:1,4-alpha-glucan branching enzyme GlgB n=1 Tax=Hippea maritima (strain ATCC 700847 / DSM 10411 / MH2) TaxID=760142 RepID=F2LVY8_HIPMA|nr:1,4-alpha-glucan branching protein GlgB [Hippea maritima]AEA33922.1 1,4-alpha-glucan-branching enzyme [Hippea maritima DSM 10411]
MDSLSLLSDYDVYLFKEGTHTKIYEKLGCHLFKNGAYFAVWAPNAKYVSVVGDFNGYNKDKDPLVLRDDGSGIWEGFVSGVKKGQTYKFYIASKFGGEFLKADPVAFYYETPPKSASVVWSLEYVWHDSEWMKNRASKNRFDSPISIYEVHLGSFMRKVEENNRWLTYKELADKLLCYVKDMGFTHIELLPITEHPFDGSWGYQTIGYFAPTSRYGTPQDFMEFVDIMHQGGVGVILDWVPSHFATDGHGLLNFDGTCLYEHKDPRLGYHPQWRSAIFNYGRNEVREFLISSAVFWLEKYHIDGLRVDGVASMLYRDFARKDGEWIPNKYGGRENLEAIDFLKQLNKTVYSMFDGVMSIAEESTSFPKVSWPVHEGGLGFGFKWNMGWMHDTLKYFKTDPLFRQHHHNELTFSIWYAFSENFILPLSHDEVVHMKGSLVNKMPGGYDEKFANLRALFAYMMSHPGKKLLFMGGEFAQFSEWDYARSLDWHLLDYPHHKGVQNLIKDLNAIYKNNPAFWKYDNENKGFEWIDVNNAPQNIIAFLRKADKNEQIVAVIGNFSGRVWNNYPLRLPFGGEWVEIFNSQDEKYNGLGKKRPMHYKAQLCSDCSNFNYFISVDLLPLSVSFFVSESNPNL